MSFPMRQVFPRDGAQRAGKSMPQSQIWKRTERDWEARADVMFA